jgi:hypothetical protein
MCFITTDFFSLTISHVSAAYDVCYSRYLITWHILWLILETRRRVIYIEDAMKQKKIDSWLAYQYINVSQVQDSNIQILQHSKRKWK